MVFPAYESFDAARAAMDAVRAGLDPRILNWMTWMSLVFASSLWFAVKHHPARWALLVGLLTKPASLGIVYLLGTEAWGLSHILLWTPLLIHLWRKRGRSRTRESYGFWLRALMITIVVSLGFDLYEVTGWAMDQFL